ncbi:MAG: DUF4124 domain-containing protein [Pseudomonadales bacterium]|nr:DUF4124 domain-containing protein [Pseudomonadales bacterium]
MVKRAADTVATNRTVPQTGSTFNYLVNPKFTFMSCFAFTLIALFTTPTAFADTYRWLDSNGVVNYSERKPRGVPSAQVTVVSDRATKRSSTQNTNAIPVPVVSNPTTSRTSTQPTRSADRENLNPSQQAMLDKLQSAEAQRQAQVEQIRMDNCRRSRRVLANLSNTGRIRVVDESGEQLVLSEDDRTQRISEAQQGIATNCDA